MPFDTRLWLFFLFMVFFIFCQPLFLNVFFLIIYKFIFRFNFLNRFCSWIRCLIITFLLIWFRRCHCIGFRNNPSKVFKRDNATKVIPPPWFSDFPISITARSSVKPWLLWIVMAKDRSKGSWFLNLCLKSIHLASTISLFWLETSQLFFSIFLH